ncbi:MAG: hypothetical protein DRI46_12050, partial [Chloroflexi bacterium]
MLIGIAGPAGSGKDTFANAAARAARAHDEWAVVDSFAAPLKRSAAVAIGVPEEILLDHKRRGKMTVMIHNEDGITQYSHKLSVRKYLQLYGTEAHRDIFGDDFWIKNLLERYWRTG